FRYHFRERVLFTGYPIHGGTAGANGPGVVTFFADPEGDPSSASGVGTQLPIAVGIDVRDSDRRTSIDRLVSDPGEFYVNLKTKTYPNGALRGQLRFADEMIFNLELQSSNVAPPISDLNAEGTARIRLNTLREE